MNKRRGLQASEKQKVLRHLAYEQIKTRILENRLESGKRINEKRLSEQLGLSRTPFREAMIMLAKEDLITHAEDGGFLVRQFSVKEIGDIFDLRNILERSQADCIAREITDEQIKDLEQILKKIRETIDAGEPPKAMVQAMEFHVKIIELCGNAGILEVMKNCYEKLTLISWSLQKIETCLESQNEHETILSALKLRDGEKLGAAVSEHVLLAKKGCSA